MWGAPPQFHACWLNLSGVQALPLSSPVWRCLSPCLMCMNMYGVGESVALVQARWAGEMCWETCTDISSGCRGRKEGRKGALFYRVVSSGCKSHSSFSQTGANACSYCGAHIIHTSAHERSPPGTPTTFSCHLWCESPVVCYFRGKEITSPPEAEGPLGESLVPSVINTSNAKPLREGGGTEKTSYHGNGVHSQRAEYYTRSK